MSKKIKPRYPIYIPSKGRSETCTTVKLLIKDKVKFYLVIEPQDEEKYKKNFPDVDYLILPWNDHKDKNGEPDGLIAVRNWIKEHSMSIGAKRHWQLDDNITQTYKRYKGKRILCNTGVALAITEDFVDRYENIAIAGLNYEFFISDFSKAPPFNLNVHVYSCTLILNEIPFKWRLRYNDDTDICLQALGSGWCTVLMNIFLVHKMQTMTLKGGNTDKLYAGDGRLKMARQLEKMWPGVVQTIRRFKRPQHAIKYQWRKFDTQLIKRKDIDWNKIKKKKYDIKLTKQREIKSERIKKYYNEYEQ